MTKFYVSIPFAIELTDEDAWEKLDNNVSYFILRCHFKIHVRQLNEGHKVGAALAVYQSPDGVGQQQVISSTFELEQLNSISSIESYLAESEHLRKFVEDFSGALKFAEGIRLSTEVKQEIAVRLKESICKTTQFQESCKIRCTKQFEIRNTIGNYVTEPVVAVPVYKRCALDIILAYIDYLRVDYKRTTFGLRKKANKHPKIIDSRKHPNKMRIGIPLATAYFWEFLPNSCKLTLEKDHIIEVLDSEDIDIRPPESEKDKHVSFPKVPTLYQIANVAFPRKWIWRKTKKIDWTEDELRRIELEEVKEGRGWWWRHGLGRAERARQKK